MKKPTLKELIESAEKKVEVADWYRKNLLLKKVEGVSESTLNAWQKEMESIPEFAEGIMKPGHSTTLIHYHTFIWFLRWKEATNYQSEKISPREALK